MKRIFLPVSLFVLFSCGGTPENQKETKKQPLSFEEFSAQFPDRDPQSVLFCSDSLIDPKGLTAIHAGDSGIISHLPEDLFRNGGYAWGKIQDGNDITLLISLMNADRLGPVFMVYDHGELSDYFVGYSSPGSDEGFHSTEWCGFDEENYLWFKDLTQTWNPDDSAGTFKTDSIRRSFAPLFFGNFKEIFQ